MGVDSTGAVKSLVWQEQVKVQVFLQVGRRRRRRRDICLGTCFLDLAAVATLIQVQ